MIQPVMPTEWEWLTKTFYDAAVSWTMATAIAAGGFILLKVRKLAEEALTATVGPRFRAVQPRGLRQHSLHVHGPAPEPWYG